MAKFNIYDALGIEDVPVTVSIEKDSKNALLLMAGILGAAAIITAIISNIDNIKKITK